MKYILIILVIGGLFGGYVYQTTREDSSETVNTSNAVVEDTSPVGEKPSQPIVDDPAEEPNQTGDTGSIAITDLVGQDTEGFPVDTNHYKIVESGDNSYDVTLYAIINRPEQYQEYLDQLKQFKEEALAYMQQNNVDTDQATITYSPSEAADL